MNEATRTLQVGLIGLGLMGRGMGLSLCRAGHRLGIVAHRRRDNAEALLAAGAWEAADAAELAAACEVVVLCLPSVEATEAVLFGAQGVASRARPSLLVIECSTLLPQAGVAFAERLAARGMDFVDAPVTRGPEEAEAGKLNALVGGAPQAVQRALPVLAAFCERTFCFGAVGQGYAAKLVNNFLAFSNLVALTEALGTATRAGLDMATLLQAVQLSGGQNRVLDGLTPWLTGSGPPRSRVTLTTAHKDVQYFGQFAQAFGNAAPLAAQVQQQLAAALQAGLGEQFTPAYLQRAGVLPTAGPDQGSPI